MFYINNYMVDYILILERYGLPVAFLAITIYFFAKSVKIHKEERAEWRTDQRSLSEVQNRTQKETNEVIRQLTAVIHEIGRRK